MLTLDLGLLYLKKKGTNMKHLDIDLASAFKNIHNLLNSHIFRETSEANGKKKVVDVFTVNYVDLRMIAQQTELVCDSADNNDVATLVAPYLSDLLLI